MKSTCSLYNCTHRTTEQGRGSVHNLSGFLQVYIASAFVLGIFTTLLTEPGLSQFCTVLHLFPLSQDNRTKYLPYPTDSL